MMNRTRASRRPRLLAGVAAVAAAAALAVAGPSTGATVASNGPSAGQPASSTAVGYVPGSRDDANNAFLKRQLERALRSRAKQPGAAVSAVTTVRYDASRAPSYRQEIAQSAQIWNSSVSNVRLVEGTPASLKYYEGNDQRGSYARTNGHGSGYVFLDYYQTGIYDALRVVAHETGHVLGLPDHYSGPCSELMSGGGAGRSCTNPYPDSYESWQVDALWQYGFAPSLKQKVAAFAH